MDARKLCCTVVSFVPLKLAESKPGLFPGHFHIAESDTKTPQVLEVGISQHFVYLDETRGSLAARDPMDEVAQSIVQDYTNSQLGISEDASPALFWLAGSWSAEEVLTHHKEKCDEMLRKQDNWFRNLAKIADDDWNRYQRNNVISDLQRKAARLINMNPETHRWMVIDDKNISCPACGTLLKSSVVICPNCRVIINKEAHAKLQFA